MKDDRNHGAPRTRRWMSQRWLVDNVIRSVGVDWDQPRSINYNAPCGPDVALRREQREKCRAERTEARVLRAIREPRRSQVEAAWVPFQGKAGPKRLVVYQDCRHSIGNVASTHIGPTPAVLAADWTNARLAGKPIASERWFVQSNGEVRKTPL